MRDLIYREILEYHPHMLADYLQNGPRSGPGYMYPSAVRAANFCLVVAHCVMLTGASATADWCHSLHVRILTAPWVVAETQSGAGLSAGGQLQAAV